MAGVTHARTRKPNSRFLDAPQAQRCAFSVILRDGSGAQCGRYRKIGALCRQHHKIEFQCCGGNDDPDPQHTQDCGR